MKTNLIKIIGTASILTCAILAIANDVNGQTPQDSVKTCKGVKADKTGCKSTFIIKGTDYCAHHNPAAIKCSGKNSKGLPCQMNVPSKGEMCRFHK